MSVKSTSKTLVTCAEMRRDITMWSAVILRIFENGSTRSPGQGSTGGWATEPPGTEDTDGTGDEGRGTAAAPLSMKLRMSCLVTRPWMPEPGIVEIST